MKQKMLFQAVLPWIAYFNICFFWGTSTVANKLGSTSMHPLMVGAVRFTVTTLLLWRRLRAVFLCVSPAATGKRSAPAAF